MSFELGKFVGKKRVLGEFRGKFCKLYASYFRLFLAQSRQRQQSLRKRPEVVAVVGSNLQLLDSCFLVSMNSGKPEEKLFDARQAPDHVIRRAQAEIRVSSVRGNGQKPVGVLIGLADLLQAVELLLVDQTRIVRLHTDAQRHGEERVRILRVRLEPTLRQFLRLLVRRKECRAQFRIRFQRDLAQKALVVQEKFRGQHALPVALLK